MSNRRTSRRWALALLSATQLVVSLDLAIVNLALPSIQDDLGVSQGDLQWIASAYAIALGGFVLLGGRAGDLVGRRRMLLLGLGLFGLGSLVAGLAWDELSLVAARGLQGLGAAVVTPAALSLLAATFPEGRERAVALGVWSAAGGLGGVAGVLLGGVMVETLGWESTFFVNLPLVAAAIVLTPLLLEESRSAGSRRFDALGAVLVTAGLTSAVVTISRAGAAGWTSLQTIGSAALALTALTAFVAVELRAADPLVSFGILRRRTVRAASVGAVLVTASVAPMLLMLTLYMQQVLDFSPLHTGLAYLAIAGTTTVWSGVASRLVARLGPRPVLATGLGLLALGLAWFARMPVDGSYARHLLPGFVVVAVGMAFSFVAVNVTALTEVAPHEAGLGSGLVGTSQQIGAALGLALLSSIAVAHTDARTAVGADETLAMNDGLHAAFQAGSLIAAAGVAAVLVLLRDPRAGRAESLDPSDGVGQLAGAA